MHGCISETVLSLFWGVTCWAFHDDSVVKNLLANARDAGDVGLTHGSGRSCGEGNGNLFQYSCLEKSHGQRSWQTTVHEVMKESETTYG